MFPPCSSLCRCDWHLNGCDNAMLAEAEQQSREGVMVVDARLTCFCLHAWCQLLQRVQDAYDCSPAVPVLLHLLKVRPPLAVSQLIRWSSSDVHLLHEDPPIEQDLKPSLTKVQDTRIYYFGAMDCLCAGWVSAQQRVHASPLFRGQL